MEERIAQLENRTRFLEGIIITDLIRNDKLYSKYHLRLEEGRNIELGTATGTQLGTSSSEKLGLYGTTPVDQPDAISSLTETGSDQDSTARAGVNDILTALREVGIIAT